ncbi:PR domain zinc finger protein 13 [Varanus komodoensis]|nr:PR domain zinc finger protein 13 [Varanus komodoensis]
MQPSRAPPAPNVTAESSIPAGLRLGPVSGTFKLGKYLSDRREPGPKKKAAFVGVTFIAWSFSEGAPHALSLSLGRTKQMMKDETDFNSAGRRTDSRCRPVFQVRMVRGELVDEAGGSAVEWIGLIRAARHSQEQTLEAIADLPGGQIFYRALRDVQPGEELTVWYSNSLAQWFDIPTTATPTHDEKGTAAPWPATRPGRQSSRAAPRYGLPRLAFRSGGGGVALTRRKNRVAPLRSNPKQLDSEVCPPEFTR